MVQGGRGGRWATSPAGPESSQGLGGAAILPPADCETLDFLVDTNVLGEERATEWVKGCLANTTNELEACNA